MEEYIIEMEVYQGDNRYRWYWLDSLGTYHRKEDAVSAMENLQEQKDNWGCTFRVRQWVDFDSAIPLEQSQHAPA